MTTSALLTRGAKHIGALREGLARWLDTNEYESVEQARGSLAQRAVPDPDAYERANYVGVMQLGMRTYG